MSAILNSAILDSDTAILDSDTLFSFLRFTQKHSHSNLTLTQNNSIWLTWWWQPSWILPSWIQPFCTKLWLKLIQSDSNSFILTQFDDVSHLEFFHLGFSHFEQKKTSFIHSYSTWWRQPSWILPSWIQPLPSWIQTPSSLRFTQKHSHSLWLKLIQSSWWWQPQFCQFRHCHFYSETNSTLTQTHSFLLLMMPSWSHTALNSAILDSAIICTKKTSLIQTPLDDVSHLEFCLDSDTHLGFRDLVIFSEIHSKTLSLHSNSDSN